MVARSGKGSCIPGYPKSKSRSYWTSTSTYLRDNAADTTNALDVAARYYCACPAGGPEVACTSSCGEPLRRFVEVDVQYAVDLLFGYPGIQDPFPLQATTTMQVR